jgi:hypothetical protein
MNNTLLFLEKSCDSQYINYLGRMNDNDMIIEYIASYYLLILKKMKESGLMQFFEQDGHSFSPYYNSHGYPLSLNEDTEAFKLFIKSLLYCSINKKFSHNKNLIEIYNFFNNLNFKIEKNEIILFCRKCKYSCLTNSEHCNTCHQHIKQPTPLYYLSNEIEKNIKKQDVLLYKKLNYYNLYIINFVYFNLKSRNLKEHFNKFNLSENITNF